eukprot:Nk52_evm5s241 gene=Nk52_evmTU5s241
MVFIGPEIPIAPRVIDFDPTGTCPDCQKHGKMRSQGFYRCTYEEFSERYAKNTPSPDLFLLCNSGISDGLCGISWTDALKLLVKTGVPMCFTAYNSEEVTNDSKLMESLGAKVFPYHPREIHFRR